MRIKPNNLLLLTAAICVMAGCTKESPSNVPPSGAKPLPAAMPAQGERLSDGEALFRQYCAPCHPDGGNVTDPQRTLRGSALKANHISTPADIVRIMRHPISRMIRFDETTISDQDARAIAEYVLATFK